MPQDEYRFLTVYASVSSFVKRGNEECQPHRVIVMVRGTNKAHKTILSMVRLLASIAVAAVVFIYSRRSDQGKKQFLFIFIRM